ncbi:response regulator [Aeromonas simiae]|uniref:Response regulator n=1 Tax=Aeromonas simiae TaxID=218936 RepID=A0A5J6X0N2_9GAMM|nr:response regulator [Aeromonas simiae]MDO2950081.1 response regulator [Aeromonas simiae]MDO2953776.1 response regulator [Aeromonas simiae]MDO2957455.1 response regulator [Aeromonas simiae]QFI56330.1 response regulator [Aeromonas simiae]
MAHILIIDDELPIRRFLRISLTAEGHQVSEAVSVDEGMTQYRHLHPDLVILDLGLPDGDGIQVLERIREHHQLPVLVLSARDSEREKVRLLDAGANDYMSKPFGIQEMMARIRVLLRQRVGTTQSDCRAFAGCGLSIDATNHKVTLHGEDVTLSRKEFALLQALVCHPGKLVLQTQLLNDIWGPSHKEDTHYLRIVVASLRKKLGDNPQAPHLIETETGIGYRFIGQ